MGDFSGEIRHLLPIGIDNFFARIRFTAYALVFIVSMLAIIATGVDDFSAFASVVATLNNLGPGLGVVADNFTSMNPVAKWILIANMLFGRLEVFTLLVLFTPTFWRE